MRSIFTKEEKRALSSQKDKDHPKMEKKNEQGKGKREKRIALLLLLIKARTIEDATHLMRIKRESRTQELKDICCLSDDKLRNNQIKLLPN